MVSEKSRASFDHRHLQQQQHQQPTYFIITLYLLQKKKGKAKKKWGKRSLAEINVFSFLSLLLPSTVKQAKKRKKTAQLQSRQFPSISLSASVSSFVFKVTFN